MKYRQGGLGRIIVAKIEHGDDLLSELKNLLTVEKIHSAIIFMIGALESASLVVGPEKCTVPPVPVWTDFADGREILGMATVFEDDNKQPVIHMHASVGRGEQVLTGCFRKDTRVYLVVEMIIFEILDTGSLRTLDEHTGLSLLGFI